LKLLLPGVTGDSLFVSVVATDRFLILKLVDEWFFLIPPWSDTILPSLEGEGGITPSSMLP
jgi:hypothetical protein